jgi:hypothetical protein
MAVRMAEADQWERRRPPSEAGRAGAGERGLVDGHLAEEPAAAAAHIPGFQQPAVRELELRGQVELVEVRHAEIPIEPGAGQGHAGHEGGKP